LGIDKNPAHLPMRKRRPGSTCLSSRTRNPFEASDPIPDRWDNRRRSRFPSALRRVLYADIHVYPDLPQIFVYFCSAFQNVTTLLDESIWTIVVTIRKGGYGAGHFLEDSGD
jgi:hypothetical protein